MNTSTENMLTSGNVTTAMTPLDDAEGGTDWYKLASDSFLVMDPIITFGGVIGNILAFLVMRRNSLRKSPVSLFLASLAVVDSSVLILDFINNYFKFYMNIHLLKYKGFCEFYRTIFNLAYTYATWLVMAVTAERFIVVWSPLKAKSWCTRKNAKIAIGVMPAVLFVIYFYNFFGYRVDEEGNCDVHPRLEYMMNNVSPWLTAVLYSYAPVVILFFSNVGIAVKLFLSKKMRQGMAAQPKDSQNDSEARWLTIMVIVVSVVFMILTVPATLWYVILFAKGDFQNLGAKAAYIETVVLILALLNHSINFFLYTLSSANFRQELKMLFKRDAKGKAKGSSVTNNSKSSKQGKSLTGSTSANQGSLGSSVSEKVSENAVVETMPESADPGV